MAATCAEHTLHLLTVLVEDSQNGVEALEWNLLKNNLAKVATQADSLLKELEMLEEGHLILRVEGNLILLLGGIKHNLSNTKMCVESH